MTFTAPWIPKKGLVRSHIDYGIYATDGPPIYHAGAILSAIAGAAADQADLALPGGGTVPLNVWVMLVGGSGSDRKTTCSNLAMKIFEKAYRDRKEQDRVLQISGSPEGIIKSIEEENCCVVYAPEGGVLFGQLRASYWEHARDVFMDLYDRTEKFTRVLSKDQFTVEKPRMSMLASCARSILASHTRPVDWQGGFMSRFLILTGERQEFRPYLCTDPDREAEIADGLRKISHAEWGTLQLDPRAATALENFAYEVHKSEAEFSDGVVPSLTRLSQVAYRLAALFEIGRRIRPPASGPTVVTRESAHRAIALCRDSRLNALRVVEPISTSHSRQQIHVESLIRQAGLRGVTRSQLVRRTRYAAKELDKIMETLKAGELVHEMQGSHPGSGRVATIYTHTEAKQDADRATELAEQDPETHVAQFKTMVSDDLPVEEDDADLYLEDMGEEIE